MTQQALNRMTCDGGFSPAAAAACFDFVDLKRTTDVNNLNNSKS